MDLNPMMRTRYLLIVAGLAMSLALGACSKGQDELTAITQTEAHEPPYVEGDVEMPIDIDFNLEASDAVDEARLLATVEGILKNNVDGQKRHLVHYDQAAALPVVCIIRSSGSDPVTYIDNLVATRKAGDATGLRYTLKAERVKLRQGSSMAAGKRWYMMVVSKDGNFNRNSGQLDFNSNHVFDGSSTETIKANTTHKLNIPFASNWVELPTFTSGAQNGQPKWPKDFGQADKNRRLTLYPLGVYCRASLRLDAAYKNQGNTTVKVTKLKVVSTGLSFAGRFKYDRASLPPISTTRQRPNIAWEPTQTASSLKEYRALDASTPEYVKVLQGDVLTVTNAYSDTAMPGVGENKRIPQGVEAIGFWAIPVARTGHTTLIAETGTSSNSKVLAPQHTYIYGKRHTKQAQNGRAVYFDAVYYHPYTPLDYMAEHNMVRQSGNWSIGRPTPVGISNRWATDHGSDAFTMARIRDLQARLSLPQIGGRSYQLPTIQQWESIIPLQGGKVNVQVGDQTRNANGESVSVQLGNMMGTAKFSVRKQANSGVMYTLAMEGFNGNNKRRVAYRYEMLENPAHIVTRPSLGIPYSPNGNLTQARDGDNKVIASMNIVKGANNLYLQVKAVQLGESFLGTVDDIANESFWNNQSKRVEVRYIPHAYEAFSIQTSLANSYYANVYPTLYYFKDNNDLVGVYSRSAKNWATYGYQIFKPRGVTEGDQVTRQRFYHVRVAVRPFTTQEHP